MEALYFGVNPNPTHLISGNLAQFALLTVVGVTLGIAICLFLVNPKFRKPQFAGWRCYSRRVGAGVGVSVAGLIIGMAYGANWSSFYVMEFPGDRVALRYFFPHRVVTLQVQAVHAIRPDVTWRGLAFLRLVTKDGRTYQSIPMYPWRFHERLTTVRNRLGKPSS